MVISLCRKFIFYLQCFFFANVKCCRIVFIKKKTKKIMIFSKYFLIFCAFVVPKILLCNEFVFLHIAPSLECFCKLKKRAQIFEQSFINFF